MPGRLRIAVTGDDRFAQRHAFLLDAIEERCARVDRVTTDSMTPFQRAELTLRELWFVGTRILTGKSPVPRTFADLRLLRREFVLSRASFKTKSSQIEDNLGRLVRAPQIVLHIFGLYRPYWTPSRTPFVQYLDFTSALARRNWPPNMFGLKDPDYAKWFALEQKTYQSAAHLFPMSELAAKSLVEDYGVPAERITTVGSSGRFREPFGGVKTFGSKQILFNGAPFERKGGDIVLAAFELVRAKIPEARLVVVGLKMERLPPGVVNPGFVADPKAMERLFLESDIVVAPARADPFPGFLIEAMSYGVPCIVSAVDGVPEIVDDGINGTVVSAPNPRVFAAAIVALLQDQIKLEAFSRAARAKVAARFTWAAIAERIVERLETIVPDASAPSSVLSQESEFEQVASLDPLSQLSVRRPINL
jgi:glycosyltransferase involved in cell wall biosynthesis